MKVIRFPVVFKTRTQALQEPTADAPVVRAKVDLRKASLEQLSQRFKELPEAREAAVAGHYEAFFLGPWWLRSLAPLSMPLVGLPGWCGKYLIGNGHATNLLRQGRLPQREAVPMHVSSLPSRVDGQPTLTLTYPPGSPLLLRFFIDELRAADQRTLLGMTTIDLPLVRRFPLPFMLRKPG